VIRQLTLKIFDSKAGSYLIAINCDGSTEHVANEAGKFAIIHDGRWLVEEADPLFSRNKKKSGELIRIRVNAFKVFCRLVDPFWIDR
jgi:hypothetical protein